MGHTKASQLFTQFCAKMSSCEQQMRRYLGLQRGENIGHYNLFLRRYTIYASMNFEIYKAVLIYLFHCHGPPVWPG